MISFQDSGVRRNNRVPRRELMRIGGLSACGLTLPQLLSGSVVHGAEGAIRPSGGRAKSCIVLFLMGGVPQQSTWDPKPDAPQEVRGQVSPIEIGRAHV